jgi:gamma-glutamyltranspeptidase/glutathione hydrolase
MAIDPRALLAASFIEERRRQLDTTRASEANAGTVAGDTIYLCAADEEGNAVSLIQSNYMGVGSGMVVPGYGIELHNRGCYFSLDPSHVNVIAPRKQPMHTLIPSLAFRNDRPAIVLGTQGGDGQPQIHLQLYTDLINFGLNIQATLELPRWVHGRGQIGDPPGLLMENRFPEATVKKMEAMGHTITLMDAWTGVAGHAHGIVIDPVTGLLGGGADPRADSSAAGW